MNQVLHDFNKLFEVVLVRTPELADEAYRLRYQIYCIEDQVPDFAAANYPNRREMDKYDRRSVQSLLRHRPSGAYVGVVRLILNDPDHHNSVFPVEEHAGRYFDPRVIDPSLLPRSSTAEISRFALLRQFRVLRCGSRGDDGSKTFAIDRRRFPLPYLGLFAAIMQMTAEHGISHWYAGMEPSLNSQLRRLGIRMIPLGPVIAYHGRRRPYLGIVDEVLASLYYHQHDVWELLTEGGRYCPAPVRRSTPAGQ